LEGFSEFFFDLLVRQFFVAELENVFDDAWVPLQLFPKSNDVAHDHRRAGERLQNCELTAFDSFGDLDFTVTSKKGTVAHFPEVHTNGVVRLFESSGCKVEFKVPFWLLTFELLFAGDFIEAGETLVFGINHLDSSSPERGKQIVQIFCGGTDFRRQK